VGKSFAIDCTSKFDKKGIFLQTAIERGANGSVQFTETTGLQSAKVYLQLSFYVNMLNLCVSSAHSRLPPPTNGTVHVLVRAQESNLMLCRFMQLLSAALMTDHVR